MRNSILSAPMDKEDLYRGIRYQAENIHRLQEVLAKHPRTAKDRALEVEIHAHAADILSDLRDSYPEVFCDG